VTFLRGMGCTRRLCVMHCTLENNFSLRLT
jgi:hypothetical protein